MEAAAKAGLKFFVLDRVTPINGVTVAEFRDDRICSFRQYWDEFAVLEQLGALADQGP